MKAMSRLSRNDIAILNAPETLFCLSATLACVWELCPVLQAQITPENE